MKYIRTAVFALLLTCMLVPASRAAEGVVWRSWDAGMKEANASGRPVLVDVYTGWCKWCQRMDADVYSRPEVRDYLSRRFVTIKLDAESRQAAEYMGKSYTCRSIANLFGVNGYPTTVFLKSGGDHMVNVPGYLKGDRFLLLLHYISEGYLDRGVSFDSYEKESATRRDR